MACGKKPVEGGGECRDISWAFFIEAKRPPPLLKPQHTSGCFLQMAEDLSQRKGVSDRAAETEVPPGD